MNYRHQFHAGNFADVWKHALLIPLVRGMQRKEKGFLFLDTHAGRGSYDLREADHGDTLQRKPEYPDGVLRLWQAPAAGLPAQLTEYVELVRRYDRQAGNFSGDGLHFYPGSPWIARMQLRPQDRLALCELHQDEFNALENGFASEPNVSVHLLDGYTAIRAMLPPREKRALVLIDPPFEEKDEFSRIVTGIREALRRMPAVTIAVWYPLTERAGADQFLDQVAMVTTQPTLAAELTIVGPASDVRMKGCGLLVVNPPWQIEAELEPIVSALAVRLAQAPGGGGRLTWVVPEK